jgi:hypothetical protein
MNENNDHMYFFISFSVISVHCFIVAFSLGIEMTFGKVAKKLHLIFATIFAISACIGIAVGIGISSTSPNVNQVLEGNICLWIVKGNFKIMSLLYFKH